MNPSYARIRLPITASLQRFAQWIGMPELEPPRRLAAGAAVSAAVEGNAWRSVVAVFVYESAGWTVFSDLNGFLASFPASRWRELAEAEELVFAGYNDAIPYGQLIVVREGKVVREFLDDRQDPCHNVNRGRLPEETTAPVNNWVGAASFVDGDELAALPEDGLLWMFGRRE